MIVATERPSPPEMSPVERARPVIFAPAALCLLAVIGLAACSPGAPHDAAEAPTPSPAPPYDSSTSNGGFWYPDLAVTYRGPAEEAPAGADGDLVVSLDVESPEAAEELPSHIDAVVRAPFDGVEPGQAARMDLSYTPTDPGPDQPCAYSVWRVSQPDGT